VGLAIFSSCRIEAAVNELCVLSGFPACMKLGLDFLKIRLHRTPNGEPPEPAQMLRAAGSKCGRCSSRAVDGVVLAFFVDEPPGSTRRRGVPDVPNQTVILATISR
jgi:hypothetical protein